MSGIRLEGIDDVDDWREDARTFIQVKTSKNTRGWSWLNRERILDRFADVHREDKKARFRIVTNFEFAGTLKTLYDFATEGGISLPSEIAGRLAPIGKRLNLSPEQMEALVRQISFEITDRALLIASIKEKLISQFEIHTGNEELYLLALFARGPRFGPQAHHMSCRGPSQNRARDQGRN